MQQTKQEKITELMSHLPRRGPNAFRCFVEALVDTDQDHVADRLSREIAEAHRMARDARSAPPLTGRLFGTAPAKVPITPPAPPAQPALAQTRKQLRSAVSVSGMSLGWLLLSTSAVPYFLKSLLSLFLFEVFQL